MHYIKLENNGNGYLTDFINNRWSGGYVKIFKKDTYLMNLSQSLIDTAKEL